MGDLLDHGAIFYVDCKQCRHRWAGKSQESVWAYEAEGRVGGKGLSYTLTPEGQTCPKCGWHMSTGDWFTLVTPVGTRTYAVPLTPHQGERQR